MSSAVNHMKRSHRSHSKHYSAARAMPKYRSKSEMHDSFAKFLRLFRRRSPGAGE